MHGCFLLFLLFADTLIDTLLVSRVAGIFWVRSAARLRRWEWLAQALPLGRDEVG